MSRPHHWAIYPLFIAGMGLGGFFDGIVFHFALQWHNLVSNRMASDSVGQLETIMRIESTFHISMWAVTGIAIYLIWQAGRRGYLPRRPLVFSGLIILGWGAFNILDGVLFHLVFQLHNVRESGPIAFWNSLWILWGIVFVAIGWAMAFGQGRRLRTDPIPSRPLSLNGR